MITPEARLGLRCCVKSVGIIVAASAICLYGNVVSGGCANALIYYGNGGHPPGLHANDPTRVGVGDYFKLAEVWEGMGIEVEYTDQWPANIAEMGLVVLVDPGFRDQSNPALHFSPEQISQLLIVLGRGGRVVVMSEHDGASCVKCLSHLFQDLQVGFAVELSDAHKSLFDVIHSDPLTVGLPYLDGAAAGYFLLSGTAKPLAVNNYWGEVGMAVDQSALTTCARPGCDVVVLSDTNMLDDLQFNNLDVFEDRAPGINEHWEPLARNLAQIPLLTDPLGNLRMQCEANARNHGEYMSCIARGSKSLQRRGCLDRKERTGLIREAAHSNIGIRP